MEGGGSRGVVDRALLVVMGWGGHCGENLPYRILGPLPGPVSQGPGELPLWSRGPVSSPRMMPSQAHHLTQETVPSWPVSDAASLCLEALVSALGQCPALKI